MLYGVFLNNLEDTIVKNNINLSRLGLTKSSYEKIKKGKAFPDDKIMEKIIKVFKEDFNKDIPKRSLKRLVNDEKERLKAKRLHVKHTRVENAEASKKILGDYKKILNKTNLIKQKKDTNFSVFQDFLSKTEMPLESISKLSKLTEEVKAKKAPLTTIVFQGGGTKGAFQAGAMLYVSKNWGEFKVKNVIGSSTGAFTALNVAGHKKKSAEKLIAFYTNSTEKDFQDWSLKFEQLRKIFKKADLSSMLDELIEGYMNAYPNEFNSYQDKVWNKNHGIQTDSQSFSEGLREDISDYANKARVLLVANFFPYVHMAISVIGWFLVDDAEEKANRIADAIEELEEFNKSTNGILRNRVIKKAVSTTIKEGSFGNRLRFYATATCLTDNYLYYLDEKGNFTKEYAPHTRKVFLPQGKLEEGVMASMAFPLAFSPVKIKTSSGENLMFADGGIRENCALAKAVSLPAERIIIIATNPHPVTHWPKGMGKSNTVVDYGKFLLNIGNHEADLSERAPRLPIPDDKEVIQVAPHTRLIGLLESDKGCVTASMLSGYLHMQTAFLKIRKEASKLSRYVLNLKVAAIDSVLSEILKLERKAFADASVKTQYFELTQRVVKTKNGSMCLLLFDELRRKKHELFNLLLAYCEMAYEVSGELELLPSNFNHLQVSDLITGVSYEPAKNILSKRFAGFVNQLEGEAQWTVYEDRVGTGALGEKKVKVPVLNKAKVSFSDLWGEVRYERGSSLKIEAAERPNLGKLLKYKSIMSAGLKSPKVYLGQYVDDPYEEKIINQGKWGFIDRHSKIIRVGLVDCLIWNTKTGGYSVRRYNSMAKGRRSPLAAKVTTQGVWPSSKANFINNRESTYDKQMLYIGKGKVLHFDPLGYYFKVWKFDNNASGTQDPLPRLVTEGKFESINGDHKLIYLGNDKLLVVAKTTGYFRVYKVNQKANEHICKGNPIAKGFLPLTPDERKDKEFIYLGKNILMLRPVRPVPGAVAKYYVLDISKKYSSLIREDAVSESLYLGLGVFKTQIVPLQFGSGEVMFVKQDGSYYTKELNKIFDK